jgi:hypothetical protein
MRPEVDDFVAVLAEAGFLVVVFVAILSVFKMIITDWAFPVSFSKNKGTRRWSGYRIIGRMLYVQHLPVIFSGGYPDKTVTYRS